MRKIYKILLYDLPCEIYVAARKRVIDRLTPFSRCPFISTNLFITSSSDLRNDSQVRLARLGELNGTGWYK